ncbi:MAG: DUF222 domain-containing protein [Candidatus Nanopelagicales bacterium]|jgi:hypothetical protein
MFESDPELPGDPDEGAAADEVEVVVDDAVRLGMACDRPVDSGLLCDLDRIELAELTADEAVTYLQQVQRFAAYVAGVEAWARDAVTAKVVTEVQGILAADVDPDQPARPHYVSPEQAAWSEVTAALRLSPVTGEARILEAQELMGTWRPMLDGMLAGTVTIEHVRAIGRQLRNLPGFGSADPAEQAEYAKHCAEVLAKVVPFAATHTPGEAGKKTRVLVTAIDPVGARKRRRKAAEQDHGVFVNPVEPGTSEIRAVMPTAHAEAVMQAVNTLAKDQRFEVADGCITRGQRRVAALVALTLGDPGSVAEVTGPVQEAKLAVHVNVLVPLDTLLGSDACGRIGNAPAIADEITDLIAQAALESSTIRRLVTDSAGCILDAGRRHYLASDLQKLVLRLRDQHCRFPGCTRPAERCEIDHAHPYDAGGHTDTCNLGPLCKHHHELKTAGYWHITTSARDGSCTWRSPLGRVYEHTPPDLVPPPPPRPPDDPPPF